METKDINESNAIHTKDEMEAIQNMVKIIKQCTEHGLNNDQNKLE